MKKTKKTLSLKQEDRKVTNFKTMLNHVCIKLKDGNYESARKIAFLLENAIGVFAKSSQNLELSREAIKPVPAPANAYFDQFSDLYSSIDNMVALRTNRQLLSQETLYWNADLQMPYDNYSTTMNSPFVAYQMLAHGNYHKFYRLMESQVAIWIVLGNIAIHNLRTEIHHKLYKYSQMKYISIDKIHKIYHEINKKPIGYKKCEAYLESVHNKCLNLLKYLNSNLNINEGDKHIILCDMLHNNGIYTLNASGFLKQNPDKLLTHTL